MTAAIEDARRAYRELAEVVADMPSDDVARLARPLEMLALDFGLLAELARTRKYEEARAED